MYAPGLSDLDDIRTLVLEVDRPVNVLLLPGGPNVEQLRAAGVRRILLGGALNLAAQAALLEAARELLDSGTAGFWERIKPRLGEIRAALSKHG